MTPLNLAVLNAARDWIGTPYLYGGALRGVGCDCVGLARGVWAQATGLAMPSTGPIAPDWHLEQGSGAILRAARPFTAKIPQDQVQPGDFALFRLAPHSGPQHLGVISSVTGGRFDRLIHCIERQGVVETAIAPGWHRNLVCLLRARPV